MIAVTASVVAAILCVLPLTQAYYNAPLGGYTYVDTSGQIISVKFGRSAPQAYQAYQPSSTFNSIPQPRKLFTPATGKDVKVATDGQVDMYQQFLKDAAEEDAMEQQKGSSKAYVSVKFGDKGYNYQF